MSIKEKITLDSVKAVMDKKGYKFFEGPKDFDLNIIGVRNCETDLEITNKFDDFITLSYMYDGEWVFHCFEATTAPGKHWAENIMRESGVAILKPGQYRGSHKIRLHGGRYTALGQKKPVKVYRDNNKDGKYDLDESTVEEGLFGINIHRATSRAGKTSTQIDKWSAGCQVVCSNDDWVEFIGICQEAREVWGNSFTYTLLESKDF